MNADQLTGKWMQFKGELKQTYGKFTDDDLKQIAGNYDKFVSANASWTAWQVPGVKSVKNDLTVKEKA